MNFLELVESRYSVRSYSSKPVEDDKLQKILQAGVMAPTAANRQAFKLAVIKTKGREEELKKIYGRDWFIEAPVVIGVYSVPEKNWVRSDGKSYSDIDASIVMDHIILAATSLGLGTCWIGAFDPKAARKLKGIEPGLEPVVFTPVGYAADSKHNKVRRPLEDIVLYL